MASNVILLYNSKTGFTQRYAELIGKELDCPARPLKDAPADLSQYSAVVFGSRLHAGNFDGWKKARKLLARRGAKQLVVFATGAMPNEAEEQIKTVWEKNLTQEERGSIPHFYLQAGMCLERLGSVDRAMLNVAAWFMGRKKDKSAEAAAFVDAIGRSYDITDEKYIRPMVDCLRELD